MVKKIRLLLDYKCYPVWLYDENDDVIDTLLPEELRNDLELDAKFDSIQYRYDELFIDNSHEFSYVGFKNIDNRKHFYRDWKIVIDEFTKKTDGKYVIQNDVDLESL